MPKYNIFKCINSSISCLYSLDWKEDDDRPYYIYWILILMKLRRGWSGITFRFHRRRFIVILPPQFFTLAYFLKLLGVVFPSWMKFFIKTIRLWPNSPALILDRPSVKCVIKKLFCFFIWIQWKLVWSCSYLCVLQLQQVSLNSAFSDEK